MLPTTLHQTLVALERWMRDDLDARLVFLRRYDAVERLRHDVDGRNLREQLKTEIEQLQRDEAGEASMCAACHLQHGRDGEACGLGGCVCHEPVDVWDRVGRPVLDPAFLRPRGATC